MSVKGSNNFICNAWKALVIARCSQVHSSPSHWQSMWTRDPNGTENSVKIERAKNAITHNPDTREARRMISLAHRSRVGKMSIKEVMR